MFNLIVGKQIGQMSANRGPVWSLVDETNQACSIRHARAPSPVQSSLTKIVLASTIWRQIPRQIFWQIIVMLTLDVGHIVLWYEEDFCISEHSLIAMKEQEVGISCLHLILYKLRYYSIHDYAKWSICELIHLVWLSIRLIF